jgi:hypothetical protein
MQVYGSEWWNPNSHHLRGHVTCGQDQIFPPSSFVDPLGHGGTIFSPGSHLITWLHQMDSRQPSEGITFWQASWTANSMSF